jgi:hypothetical protein
MARALLRLIASPVRITAPVSISPGARPASSWQRAMKRPRRAASMLPSARKGVSRIGDFHRMRRSTTTNWLESAWVLRCSRTLANMRCEVELPMSMPTVVSSTFSTFQMYSVSSPRRPTDIS